MLSACIKHSCTKQITKSASSNSAGCHCFFSFVYHKWDRVDFYASLCCGISGLILFDFAKICFHLCFLPFQMTMIHYIFSFRWCVTHIFYVRFLRGFLNINNVGLNPPPVLRLSDGGHFENLPYFHYLTENWRKLWYLMALVTLVVINTPILSLLLWEWRGRNYTAHLLEWMGEILRKILELTFWKLIHNKGHGATNSESSIMMRMTTKQEREKYSSLLPDTHLRAYHLRELSPSNQNRGKILISSWEIQTKGNGEEVLRLLNTKLTDWQVAAVCVAMERAASTCLTFCKGHFLITSPLISSLHPRCLACTIVKAMGLVLRLIFQVS